MGDGKPRNVDHLAVNLPFTWQARASPTCQKRWETVTSEEIIGRPDSALRDAISHLEMIRFFRVLNRERAEPETPLAHKTLRQAYSEVMGRTLPL